MLRKDMTLYVLLSQFYGVKSSKSVGCIYQAEKYEELGIDEYEYIACGLKNCCEICKALDGQVFKVKDMECGKNAPPMHPNCHCATAPHIDRQEFNKWLDEKETYGTSLSFKEWKKPSEYGFPLRLNLQNFAKKYEQIYLPKKEYARVMSEINTWVKEKDVIKSRIYKKTIGDYIYTFIYKGFNNYTFISKEMVTLEENDDV